MSAKTTIKLKSFLVFMVLLFALFSDAIKSPPTGMWEQFYYVVAAVSVVVSFINFNGRLAERIIKNENVDCGILALVVLLALFACLYIVGVRYSNNGYGVVGFIGATLVGGGVLWLAALFIGVIFGRLISCFVRTILELLNRGKGPLFIQ